MKHLDRKTAAVENRTKYRTLTPIEPTIDMDELTELQALTKAINILTKCITCPQEDTRILEGDPELDELDKCWKLEQTGFPRLYNACKQLKENLRLTGMEADEAVHDINKAHQYTQREKARGDKMKKLVQKLYQENRELHEQNKILASEAKRHKKQKKMIVQSVRSYISSICSSGDKENPDINENIHTISTTADDGLCNTNQVKCSSSIDEISIGSATSEGNTSTNSTTSSLITDEGCATLRFEKKERRSVFSLLRSATKSSNVYSMKFKTTTPGLQFLQVTASRDKLNVASDEESTTKAFLVCGFKGFRDNLYKRPTFGARLISINGESMEEKDWSMSDLTSHILYREHPEMKLTFRNDAIPPHHMEQLKARSRQIADKPQEN